MRLTKKNYHTRDNQYLSNSKVKEFLRDPYYFYQRFVTGDLVFEPTPSMRVGSAVDTYLTGSRAQFNKQYQEKVLKKDNPELFDVQKFLDPAGLLSPAEFTKVMDIVERVKKLTVYKDIKKEYKAQRILKLDKKLGMFDGICGIPDWYRVVEDKAIIIDLKTTASVDERKFKYSCYDFGYFMQQAMYQMLLSSSDNDIKTFKSFILAVETTQPYSVRLYELDQKEIEMFKMELTGVLDLIASYDAKDFKPKDLTWGDAITL
jgi:hypothetical protein